MLKTLFVFILSLSIFGQAFATLGYVEFEPGNWSIDNDILDFEQGLEIQYAEGNTDLIGYIVNVPQLTLVDNTVYEQGNVELFDNFGSKLVTAYFDTGTYTDGLTTDKIFYNIDMTEPHTTYIINDIELMLHKTGSEANTFDGNMTLTFVPEPSTLLLLAPGALLLCKRR